VDLGRAGKILDKPPDVFDVSTAPSENGLVIIVHREDLLVPCAQHAKPGVYVEWTVKQFMSARSEQG
jgi:hypothetical protein